MQELVVSRRSPYIRAFIWLWGAERLDTCRLFWGTVFFPIGLFARPKPIFGFVPRLSLLLFLGAAVEFGVAGDAIFASTYLGAGLLGMALGYRHRRLGKPPMEEKFNAFLDWLIESPATSARRTRRSLVVVSSPIWVSFFLVFKVVDGVIELVKSDRPVKEETGTRTKKIGIGGVLVHGFKAFKQKACLRVKLI